MLTNTAWCDEHEWLSLADDEGFPRCDGLPHKVDVRALYDEIVVPAVERFEAEVKKRRKEALDASPGASDRA